MVSLQYIRLDAESLESNLFSNAVSFTALNIVFLFLEYGTYNHKLHISHTLYCSITYFYKPYNNKQYIFSLIFLKQLA